MPQRRVCPRAARPRGTRRAVVPGACPLVLLLALLALGRGSHAYLHRHWQHSQDAGQAGQEQPAHSIVTAPSWLAQAQAQGQAQTQAQAQAALEQHEQQEQQQQQLRDELLQEHDVELVSTMAPSKPHAVTSTAAAAAPAAVSTGVAAPLVPKLDLVPQGVLCSQGAGPRCVLLPGGVYQLSSYVNSHGVMYCPNQYLYGYFSVRIKFQAGYTGGINTAFYLIDTVTSSNSDPGHAEIDMEFYGGRNASRIMMTTNVFAGGYQNLAEFRIPFDGSKAFHDYSISWSKTSIVWYVDGVPFRVLNRRVNYPWPRRSLQPMLSVWDTSSWTKLKAKYKKGPVSSWFQDFRAYGCSTPGAATSETGCAAIKDPAYVWNKPLGTSQLRELIHMRSSLLLHEWGWDKTKPAA